MRYFLGVAIGYLLGCISPTYLFSVIKNIDMRKSGTGNLGATNAMLTLGKGVGAAVMLFDIAKAFVPVLICKILFFDDHILMLSVGLAAVVGHAFPFYLKFKGGKGVATLAGLLLAYNPLMFLMLFSLGALFVLIFRYVFALPISAAALFPVLVGIYTGSLVPILLSVAIGTIVIFRHKTNFARVLDGREMKITDYFRGTYQIEKVEKKKK